MELPDLRAVHALLYEDRMEILRTDSEPNEYGIVSQERKKVLEWQPCKLSMFASSKEDNPGDDSIYYRKANSVIKIFLDPGIKIIQGDWINVYRKRRGSDEYELFFKGLSNKPNVHTSHQEVEVAEREVN